MEGASKAVGPAWLTSVTVVVAAGLAVFAASLAIGAAATTMTEHGVSVGAV
jgi:hypothetical protein